MNVLIIGSGGREHALAKTISRSKSLNKLYTSPGNPGTAEISINVNAGKNHDQILKFCTENKIDLVVIGPEQPLVDGLADFLRTNGILVFGPDKKAAEIEGHKSFAKHLMVKYGIPTAEYKEFESTQIKSALTFLKNSPYPVVIKADGLAAGKGVVICNNYSESEKTLNEIFVDNIFGESGNKVIIEEFLEGEEASILAITDGDEFVLLPSSQDHKKIGENDTGKNTGGMGAYSPAPVMTDKLLKQVEESIIKPALAGMKSEDKKFSGCLYAGLMITNDGPKVIEFNCRFGDPETQAVLPLLEGDFLKLLYSSAFGQIDKNAVKYSGGTAVCVVAVSKGYPDKYQKGFEIMGLQEVSSEQIIVFHAGTEKRDGKIITAGGRVLGVTSVIEENDLQKARLLAYEALDKIKYEGISYRRDIGLKALKHIS